MAEQQKQPNAKPQAAAAQPPETVTLPASQLQTLMDRLEALERQAKAAPELFDSRAKVVLDKAFEDWKAEASLPASVRTQKIADKTYGTEGQRFHVELQKADDSPRGMTLGEHPALVISANSDLEAMGRWQKLCGVTSHKHKLIATLVTPQAAA